MNSLIVQAWSMLLKPLMLVFSIFLLVRGHHEPGGGFVGGMVAAAAFTLSALAYDVASAKQTLHVRPIALAALGLIIAATSGFVAVLTGEAYMTGVWANVWLPLVGEVDLGSVLLFDLGIYLVVAGITLMIVFALMESQEEYGN